MRPVRPCPPRRPLRAAGAALALLALAAAPAPAADGERAKAAPEEPAAERARAALAPFKRELMAALKKGLEQGPAEAITVCRDRAPALAAEASHEGARVGRTSHRLRSPANAPEPWMEPLLAHYLEKPSDRAPRTVRIDERRFGYVEPIETKPLCLTCHGSDLAPAVRERIDVLYPQDDATGFEGGELRGLFWATVPAPEG